ncbi:MAG: Hsp20/alpha crystallin family protein [Deltaproteobacteria bacterium]|nr:MAG: Hsp20/alpha crystallin family protein [Deltaproteobacteria bacterium]
MTTSVATQKESPRRVYRPRVDVIERSGEYVIEAELPGIAPDAVDLTIEKDSLTLRGRAPDEEREGYKLVHAEYAPREFSRTFVLSDEIDVDSVRATMKNGVLKLTLPKAAEKHGRQITVEAA